MGLSWSDLDPTNLIRQANNEVKKQTDSIGRGINKSAISIGKSAEINWKNAGRGEVGKFLAQQGQAEYNKNLALPRAIQTGQWNKEGQRFVGGMMVNATPIESYVGNNKSLMRTMNDDNLNKNTLGITSNFANSWHGIDTAATDGKISNADRNDMWQGLTKAAAAVAVYFGGSAAYGAFAGGGEAAAGVGAVEVAGGTPLVEGAVVSTSIGAGSTTAAGTTAAAATGSGMSWSTWAATGGLGALSALTGGKGAGSSNAFDFGQQDDGSGAGDIIGGIGDMIGGLFGGGNKGPSGTDYSGLLPVDDSGYAVAAPAAAGISIVAVGAVIAGVYFARKKGLI